MLAALLLRDLGPLPPRLGQADGNGLLGVGHLPAGLTALELALLELVHRLPDRLLGFFPVAWHGSSSSFRNEQNTEEMQCKRGARRPAGAGRVDAGRPARLRV